MPQDENVKTRGRSRAFTLIELLVVLSIMAIIGGAVIANYAGQRTSRNLRIAQDELVTNIRKAQSYSLSSRQIPGGITAQYYILKFNTASSSKYVLEGMYNVKNPPAQVQDIETINLPQNIVIGSVTVNGGSPLNCILLAYQLPFATILVNSSCNGTEPGLVTTGDDYNKISNFIVNNGATVTSDSKIVITLKDKNGALSNKTLINGTTGVICPTSDGLTCQGSF